MHLGPTVKYDLVPKEGEFPFKWQLRLYGDMFGLGFRVYLLVFSRE